MTTVAKRIHQRRKRLKLSQQELADRAGIDQTQVSRYELGKNEPGGDTLAALARALDTTTDWLLGLTNIADRPLRNEADLSDDERELITLYRAKPSEKRRQAIEVLRVI